MCKTTLSVIMSATILALTIFVSCNNDDSQDQKNEIQVRFIEQICCGNLKTLNNALIDSPCETYQDSLLGPTNFNDFAIFESIQTGDIITIEYELTEGCEARCEVICNRMNGIPIKLLSVDN